MAYDMADSSEVVAFPQINGAGACTSHSAFMSLRDPVAVKSATGAKGVRRIQRATLSKDPRKTREDWTQSLQTDDRGQIIPNLANAAAALREAPELSGIVAYDLMMRTTTVTRRLDGSRMKAAPEKGQIQDADVSEFQEWMQHHGISRIGKEVTQQAVDLVAREHAFHPVRDYLNGLKWDGTKRLERWLTYYLGAEEQPKAYLAAVGAWVLIAMVARIMKPGCKCDYMVVLEGDQGTNKSTACAILAGDWYSDNLPELHSGDEVRISMHLRGKWLIEIGELSSIGKAEADALKSFLTRREERYTPKFGRNEVIEPRQCLFIGTTNKNAYLRDETGDRRSWPVKAGNINLRDLDIDRDQLFAEAVVAYQRGDHYWPDPEFEAQHIKPEQEQRFVADAWEPLIAEWLGRYVAESETNLGTEARKRCTVDEVASQVLDLQKSRLGTAEQRRITAALSRSGWVSKRNEKGRWWAPGPAALPPGMTAHDSISL